MVSKRWNAVRASFWAAIIGAAYVAGSILIEGRPNEPIAMLVGELAGGAMGFALFVGLWVQARNWVTGAR